MPTLRALPLVLAAATLGGCMPPDTRQLVRSLDREVMAMHMENERLNEQLATCDTELPPPSQLYTELYQVFSTGEIEVERDAQEVRVVVPGELMFSTGSVVVRDEAAMVLDLLSTALQLHTEYNITIVAHTDDRPTTGRLKRSYPTNWELSGARASAVARELFEGYGISPHRFTIAGRAGWAPIADNSTPEGREANRRVEFHLIPQESP